VEHTERLAVRAVAPRARRLSLHHQRHGEHRFGLGPAPDVTLLHVNRIGEPTLASPALVDGR
jgi:hypothetical protein